MNNEIIQSSENQQVSNLFSQLLSKNSSQNYVATDNNFSSLMENISSKSKMNFERKKVNESTIEKQDVIKTSDNKAVKVRKNDSEDDIKKDENDIYAVKEKSVKKEETTPSGVEEESKVEELPEEETDKNKLQDEDTSSIQYEFIQTMMQTLKDTGNFSNEELSDIKNFLEKNLNFKDGFDLNKFLENLQTSLGNETFEKLSSLDVFESLQESIKIFFTTNNIDVSKQEISSKLKDGNLFIDKVEKADEEPKSSLLTIFENLLTNIFDEDPSLNNDKKTILSNMLSFSTNTDSVSQNLDLTSLGDFLQGNMQNPNYENSSMMNLTKKFEDTQDIMKIISGTNTDSNNILSAKESIKTLDSIASTRVMERVEEALKAVSKSKDGSTISLRLDPPSLGEVKIDVTMKDGILFARLQADSNDVENLLKNKSLELQQVLQDAGLDVDSINVYIASKDSEEDKNQSSNSNNEDKKENKKIIFSDDLENASESTIKNESEPKMQASKWIA